LNPLVAATVNYQRYSITCASQPSRILDSHAQTYLLTIALKRDARDDDISGKDREEKETSPPVVVLGLIDLEGLLKGRLVVVTVHLGARVEVLAVVGRRLRIALAILVRLLVVLLLIVLLAILVVGLLRLHGIVFCAIIAIRHLIVAVCFTAGHSDSRVVEGSAEKEFCAKQGMRPMGCATPSECFCIPALAQNPGSKLSVTLFAATGPPIVLTNDEDRHSKGRLTTADCAIAMQDVGTYGREHPRMWLCY